MVAQRIETIERRSIRPDDFREVLALHERLSETSLYLRYLSYTPPSMSEIAAMCAMGPRGVVALAGARVVGLGYYVPRGSTAEPALLVDDAYQRRGIGSGLFWKLAERARHEGIVTFEAVATAENRGLMNLLRHSGLDFYSHFAYGFREIVVALV